MNPIKYTKEQRVVIVAFYAQFGRDVARTAQLFNERYGTSLNREQVMSRLSIEGVLPDVHSKARPNGVGKMDFYSAVDTHEWDFHGVLERLGISESRLAGLCKRHNVQLTGGPKIKRVDNSRTSTSESPGTSRYSPRVGRKGKVSTGGKKDREF